MGVDLYPKPRAGHSLLHLSWDAWGPVWMYPMVVAGDALDEQDYELGGMNDGHLISTEKARRIAEILEARLVKGLRDDGDALHALEANGNIAEKMSDEVVRASGRDPSEV